VGVALLNCVGGAEGYGDVAVFEHAQVVNAVANANHLAWLYALLIEEVREGRALAVKVCVALSEAC